DIAPARTLGLSTVWINRRHAKPGFGATPPAQAQPDFEVADMRIFAEQLGVPPPPSARHIWSVRTYIAPAGEEMDATLHEEHAKMWPYSDGVLPPDRGQGGRGVAPAVARGGA